jgi:hypothetical protein
MERRCCFKTAAAAGERLRIVAVGDHGTITDGWSYVAERTVGIRRWSFSNGDLAAVTRDNLMRIRPKIGALSTGRFARAEWRVSARTVGHVDDAKRLELVDSCISFERRRADFAANPAARAERPHLMKAEVGYLAHTTPSNDYLGRSLPG